MKTLALVVPGSLDTPTGGYRYDRRMAEGLRRRGWRVDVISLPGVYPCPSVSDLERARVRLDALCDGARVVVDGLALGGLGALVGAAAARLRMSAIVHHPLAEETGLTATLRKRLRAEEARGLARMQRVVVPSRSTARGVEALGVERARIAVVPPGTTPRAVPPRACRVAAPVRLLCVGAVVPRKGHAVLVRALAGLADRRWQLVCAGTLTRSDAAVAQLRTSVRRFGLDGRITLPGEVDDAALELLYQRADCFVLASYHEGYGMVLAEALAHGLPVVSTRAGAIPEVVPSDAGLLVAPGDVGALRCALARVLGDPDLRADLADAAVRAASALPTWEEAVVRFEAELEQA